MKKTRLLSFKTSPLSWKVYETMAKNKMSMGILHCNSATWKYENVKKNCVQGISRTNRWIKDVIKIFSIRYCRHVNFSGLKRNKTTECQWRNLGYFTLCRVVRVLHQWVCLFLRNHQKPTKKRIALQTYNSCGWKNITTCNIYDYTIKLTKSLWFWICDTIIINLWFCYIYLCFCPCLCMAADLCLQQCSCSELKLRSRTKTKSMDLTLLVFIFASIFIHHVFTFVLPWT